jgi:hypothetical protein
MKTILQKNIQAGIILVCLILLPGFTASAETDNGSITGIIVDDSTAAPVSFASVSLLNATDSSLLTGAITNEQGKFQFLNIPYGNYNVKVTFVGYKAITVKNLEVNKQNKVIDLKEMKLVEDLKTINAAVVVGQRLKGEEKVDRTVFTLNDDIRKASTTALDALKHIPSVTVDFQNNVSLEGQSNIQFYVDGVLRNKEYVAQIKPDMIDKIELITNPGVRYDADVSGVINIVLRKEARYGVSGSVKIPIPNPDKILAEPSGNVEYGNQRFRFYIADQMHFEQFRGTEKVSTRVEDLYTNPYRFEKTGKGINSWQNNYMNYGIDWFINDKTSLNFLGEWRNWKGVANNYRSESKRYVGDNLTEYLKTGKNTLDKSDNFYFSLFFQKKFKKEGDEIKVEGYVNRQTGKAKNEFSELYIDPVDLTAVTGSIERVDLTENLRRNGELKLDLAFMLKNVKNEAGIRTYAAWMDNDFTKEYTIEELTNKQHDDFSYQETRQTAYYNLSGKIKKFTWQAGLRGEYSWLDINSAATADYIVLLPQASINKSLPKEQSLKLSFRKQISRPSISSLNPFDIWTDSLHLRRGNPNLDAAIENRFEFTYTRNFKANYLSPKVYLRYTTNGIQDNTTVTDKGVTLITQDNVGRNMEYGLGLNGAFQIMKRWRFNGNVSVYKQLIRTNEVIAGHSKEEIISCRFNFSNIVTLPKDYTLFMFANYGSPGITYQRIFSRQFLMLIGAEKKFSDKFSADVLYNPFIKDFMYQKIVTTTPGYRETWEGNVDVNQLFSFSVTYNFNRGNKINKINRAVEYERNESKGGL